MKSVFLWILTMITLTAIGQSTQTSEYSLNEDPGVSDEELVRDIIENFLVAVGDYDIDSVATMFTDKANISGSSLRDGMWSSYTMTIQEFLSMLRESPNPRKYKEPVNNWTIQIEAGRLAFVRADATLFVDGKVQRQNIDYFTLIKENDQWKILNGSYVSQPMDPEKK